MTETLTGIVIKKLDYMADDQIITVMTDSELVTFIALGTKKMKSKNRVALDYGNLVNVEIFRARLSNKLSKLKKAVLIKQPPIKTSDTASVILTIVKFLSQLKSSSQKLFKGLLETFPYYGDTYNHHIKTYIMFKSLDTLGVYPETQQCVECGRSDRIVSFDYKTGGFLCVWHTKEERPIEELKAIKDMDKNFALYKEVDPALNKKIYEELIKITNQYIYFENKNSL